MIARSRRSFLAGMLLFGVFQAGCQVCRVVGTMTVSPGLTPTPQDLVQFAFEGALFNCTPSSPLGSSTVCAVGTLSAASCHSNETRIDDVVFCSGQCSADLESGSVDCLQGIEVDNAITGRCTGAVCTGGFEEELPGGDLIPFYGLSFDAGTQAACDPVAPSGSVTRINMTGVTGVGNTF